MAQHPTHLLQQPYFLSIAIAASPSEKSQNCLTGLDRNLLPPVNTAIFTTLFILPKVKEEGLDPSR